jgi:hypothetical protein
MDLFAVVISFLIGFIVAAVAGAYYQAGRIINFFHQAEASLLLMVVKLEEDIAFLNEFKSASLLKSGMTEQEVERSKEMDERLISNWKEVVVRTMISNYPPVFKNKINYSDWQSALKYIHSMKFD